MNLQSCVNVSSLQREGLFQPTKKEKKVGAVPQAGDKVKEIMFDLLWHSYNYLDPGGGPFLWLGCCLLIFHVEDVKAESQLVVEGGTLLEIP